jgi:hypothetical protein
MSTSSSSSIAEYSNACDSILTNETMSGPPLYVVEEDEENITQKRLRNRSPKEQLLELASISPNHSVTESWNPKKEALIRAWRDILIKDSDIHERASRTFKKSYNIENNISIIIPLFMSILQSIFIFVGRTTTSVSLTVVNGTVVDDEKELVYMDSSYRFAFELVNSIAYAILALLRHSSNTKMYGPNSVINLQYASRYSDIITKIDLELARDPSSRMNADVFISELRYNISNLRNNSPPVV